MVRCSNCGQDNNPGSTFCAFCGFKFDAPGAAAPPPPPPPSTPQPPQMQPPQQPPPGGPTPTGSTGPVSTKGAPSQQVVAPAVALMIFAGLNAAQGLLFVVIGIRGMVDPSFFEQSGGQFGGQNQDPMMTALVALGLASAIILSSAFVFYSAWNMRKLTSYTLVMIGVALSMIPCFTIYCCPFGIGFGIWALVVLFRPEVKNAFQ